MSSNAHSDASSPLKSLLLLLGVVAGLVVVDAGLLLATSTTGSELLRLALAGGAFAVPLLGFAVGIVHRPIYAVGAILSVPFVAVYAYTGLLLPWTQLSFSLGRLGLELLLGIPVVGEPATTALFGGTTLSQATLHNDCSRILPVIASPVDADHR